LLNVVADTGYSNGAQAEACEQRGIVPHVPALRGVNKRGDGMLPAGRGETGRHAGKLTTDSHYPRQKAEAAPPESCSAAHQANHTTIS
jgi:hypothetical protein